MVALTYGWLRVASRPGILKHLLFCSVILSPVTRPSVAGELVFKIIKVPNTPMAGTILLSEGGAASGRFRDVPATGSLTVKDYDCHTRGSYFSAVVENTKLKLVDETKAEKDCKLGNLTFEFEEKRYAWVLTHVINGDPLKSVEVNADLQKLQESLRIAYDQGDKEKSLKTSSQISSMLRSMGYASQAKSYETYNFDIVKYVISGHQELYFDPKQKSYVLTDQDLEKIKQVQAANGLDSTGMVGWRTMEALGRVEPRF